MTTELLLCSDAPHFHSSIAGRNIQTAAFSNGRHVKAKWLWGTKQERGRTERQGGSIHHGAISGGMDGRPSCRSSAAGFTGGNCPCRCTWGELRSDASHRKTRRRHCRRAHG